MDNKEKDGSPAGTAMGTAQSSSTTNISIPTSFFQEESYSVLETKVVEFVAEKASSTGNIHKHKLSELADEVVRITRFVVEFVNVPKKNGGRQLKWPMPKQISPVQAGQLVFKYELIRMVCTKESVKEPKVKGVIAMYADSGPDEGTYHEIGPGDIDDWCEQMAGSVNTKWKEDFQDKICDLCSRTENRVIECTDGNLVFMKNGIFNYKTKELKRFDCSIVTLRKSDTVLPDKEPPVPVHVKPDGTTIDFWEFLESLAPYAGGTDLLVKLAGAVLRNRHNWRAMVTLFNASGHNGKSTFLKMLKALVGAGGVMISSVARLAGSGDGARFGVANIAGKSLITCEDSDSGAYLKDNSRLKCIISHDAIEVERKGLDTYDYTPYALVVCASNDLAKTKDKGQAWLERNLYVPFTGRFIGSTDDKTISSEWVESEEFLSYMAYQALVKWESYDELPEPQMAIDLKKEFIIENDAIAEFWDVYMSYCDLDFIPSRYAWWKFKEWINDARPTTSLPSEKAFIKHLIEIAESDGEWTSLKGKDNKGSKLTVDSWCIGHNMNISGRSRGLVRKKMWDYCQEHSTTPKALGVKYDEVRKELGLVLDKNEE